MVNNRFELQFRQWKSFLIPLLPSYRTFNPSTIPDNATFKTHWEANPWPPLLSKSPSLLTQINTWLLAFLPATLPVFATQQSVIFLNDSSYQIILTKNPRDFPSDLEWTSDSWPGLDFLQDLPFLTHLTSATSLFYSNPSTNTFIGFLQKAQLFLTLEFYLMFCLAFPYM